MGSVNGPYDNRTKQEREIDRLTERLYYACPFCRRNWIDRGARESLVCPGCGAGPEEFAQYILKKGAEVKVLRSKDDG